MTPKPPASKREVELLDEYRARLIADVVTGKLDARGAAAALPEVDPLDAEDDPGGPLDADAGADPRRAPRRFRGGCAMSARPTEYLTGLVRELVKRPANTAAFHGMVRSIPICFRALPTPSGSEF